MLHKSTEIRKTVRLIKTNFRIETKIVYLTTYAFSVSRLFC